MKKVLIITYYWPPAGGPGVQRVLKFCKYLPDFGWQPIILTVRKGEFIALDPELEEDIRPDLPVFKTRSFEPNILYKKFVGIPLEQQIPDSVLAEKNISWQKRIAHWIRLNVFIPDAKIGWKPFAVKAGKEIIRNLKPALIFSSSPPPTVHLIALKLAKWSDLPWLADFRDPWTRIHYYESSRKNPLSGLLNRYLEKKVIQSANKVTAIIPGFFEEPLEKRITVLDNGFDPDDIQVTEGEKPNSKFTIRYMGSLTPSQYVPIFFKLLQDLCNDDFYAEKISAEFIGNISEEIRDKITTQNTGCPVQFVPYLSHKEVLKQISHADLLLLFINKSESAGQILTGKVFEYLMVQKPILAYGPPGGASDSLLKKTGAGQLFDYDDYQGSKRFIVDRFHEWQTGKAFSGINLQEINKYNRKELTGRLADLFSRLI